MMVRFSCFNAHIHCHKPKKTFQPSVEAMQHNLEDSSQIQAPSGSPESKSLSPSFLKPGDSHSDDTSKPASFTSVDRGWKSEEIKGKFNFEVGAVAHQTRCIKKSQSLGSELFLKERAPDENNVYDGTDQGFSSDSCEQNDWVVLDSGKDSRGIARYQKAPHSESVQVSSDRVNNGSIFSVGDPPHSEKESCQYSDSPLSGDRVDDSGNNTSHTPPGIVKSSSSPNIVGSVPTSGGLSPLKYLTPQSRSSDDIHALDIWRKENQVPVYVGVRQEHGRDGNIHKSEKDNLENFVDDGFDSYNYSALAKDWIVPVTDEVILENFHQGDSSVQHGDDLPSKDYKIKRIEDWVNDLQHCSALVEANELLDCSDQSKRESSVLNDLNAAKVEVKVTPGMEAAKKYISSLSALASAAQLANHGLVVIPFLSAFSSLRVLNLSGNAIVRITAGALPRGLHMLNLSKNNISTIEGLRELTRLRVLDLSYNRIFRIGHGLASCSSLKELYLAGNKISEVEGLHRLLKLTVLDLRFNKISTTKCLGQLAANYNSLQAISLEGNPAQKNVGDEQLKKYLQGLLPHLTYFNRQQIRASSLKDAADRSVRLGISGHQFDRGLRSELKGTRRSSHGVAAHRPSSSATHGRKSQIVVSPKRSKGRHGRLPPTGIKAMPDNQHYFDFSSKLISFRSKLSIPRSRSEGTLGVL